MEYPYKNKEWLTEQILKHGNILALCEATEQPVTSIRRYVEKFQLEHLLVKPKDYKKPKDNYEKYPFQNKKWLEEQIKIYGSVNEICRQTGCAETSIRRYVEKFNLKSSLKPVEYTKRPNYEKYPFKNKEWLKKQILKYNNVSNISEQTGCAKTSLYRYIDYFKLNDMLINPKEYRIYNMNEDYFQNINTEHKAYWLGLITADGNVSNLGNKYCIRFSLKHEDGYLPYYFLQDTKSDAKISIDKYERVTARVFSKKMFEDLLHLGVVPNKTGKESIPNIPSELMGHFVRGFFDGDGTIYKRKNRSRHKCTIGFCCQNEKFVQTLIHETYKHCGVEVNYYEHKNNVFEAKTESFKKCLTIMEWIYKDATIAMIRKFNKAEKLLNINCPSLKQFEDESRLIDGEALRALSTKPL
mgnify:CR=1 FL=1